MKQIIQTDQAPAAIGAYSQAVKAVGTMVYISGQIPLDPKSMQMVQGDMKQQVRQVFQNLASIAQAAGGKLTDVVKLTIYLKDLAHFPVVNEVVTEFFQPPYPARAVIGVSALPKDATVEAEAIMHLGHD